MVPQRPCCGNGFPLASILLLCAQHQDPPDTGAGVTVRSCVLLQHLFGNVSVEVAALSDLSVALLLLAGPQLVLCNCLLLLSSWSTPSLKATSQRSCVRSATRVGTLRQKIHLSVDKSAFVRVLGGCLCLKPLLLSNRLERWAGQEAEAGGAGVTCTRGRYCVVTPTLASGTQTQKL